MKSNQLAKAELTTSFVLNFQNLRFRNISFLIMHQLNLYYKICGSSYNSISITNPIIGILHLNLKNLFENSYFHFVFVNVRSENITIFNIYTKAKRTVPTVKGYDHLKYIYF